MVLITKHRSRSQSRNRSHHFLVNWSRSRNRSHHFFINWSRSRNRSQSVGLESESEPGLTGVAHLWQGDKKKKPGFLCLVMSYMSCDVNIQKNQGTGIVNKRTCSSGNLCSLSFSAATGFSSFSAKSRHVFLSIWWVSGSMPNDDKLRTHPEMLKFSIRGHPELSTFPL